MTRSLRHRQGWALALAALCLVVAVQNAGAGAATDQLKRAIDRVLTTVDDPALKGDAGTLERRAAVRKIANEIFDFTELARRSLGRYWQPLSEPQRMEFVWLFAELLERSYVSKIELYGGEQIIYSGERVEGDLAIVRTKIITDHATEVPVDYRLLRQGDRWMIYDVSIDGISLVSNYRTQFNKIIRSDGYEGLIEKMKTKHTQFAADDAQKKKAR